MLKHFRRRSRECGREAVLDLDSMTQLIICRSTGGVDKRPCTAWFVEDVLFGCAIPRWAALALARAAVKEMERDG